MAQPESVQSLESILTRLALTNEAQLQKVTPSASRSLSLRASSQVLWKLIPGVIRQLQFPDAARRNKVLQILSHVNQRLDAEATLELPLLELTTLLREADAHKHSMVRSLALVYVEKATNRSSAQTRLRVLPDLMKGVAQRPSEQRSLLLRFAVAALEERSQQQQPSDAAKKQKTEDDDAFSFLQSVPDRKAFLEFAAWTLLYQPKHRVTPKELILNGKPLEMPPEVFSVLRAVPAGLSLDAAQSVQGKVELSDAQLQRKKLGLLAFLKGAELGAEAFIPYLIASADPVEEVAKIGEALLKKHFRVEADSKEINLNEPQRVRELLTLFHGSLAQEALPSAENVRSFVTPAAPGLKMKLLSVLVKSTEAANQYPLNIQVVWSAIFGEHVPMTLRLQAMEFSVWIIKHAETQILQRLAAPMLTELLVLFGGETTANQRGYIYEALSQLAPRYPTIFHGKIHIVEALLVALENEPPGVRSQLQLAVASLSAAFRGEDAAVQTLLLKSIQSRSSAVRLVAVAWAMRLFPFEAPLGRYLCIVGAADERPEVQSEAQLGLDPAAFRRERTNAAATFPSIPTFLAFLKEHATECVTPLVKRCARRLCRVSQGVYPVLVRFLRRCHSEAPPKDQTLSLAVLQQLLALYEAALTAVAATALAVEVLEAMVSLIRSNKAPMATWSGQKMTLLNDWLSHTSDAVRVPCAQLIGLGATTLPPSKASQLVQTLRETLDPATKSKFESKSGAIQALGQPLIQIRALLTRGCCLGYLTAACENPELLKTLAEVTSETLLAVLQGSDPHLAATTALCLSHQLLNPSFVAALAERCTEERFVEWLKEHVCTKLLELCRHQDLRVASTSVLATGLLSRGLAFPDLEALCLMHLVSLQSVKNEELQCLIGEAMAFAFAKDTISTDWILISNFTYLRELPLKLDALEQPRASGTVHEAVVEALLVGMSHSRTENRSACVSHAVTLLTYCPRHPSLATKLEAAQNAFLGLLGDKNGLTQEMASRGVSLVYRLGDAEMKSTLLSGLTAVLKDPNKRGTTVKVEADTEVFAEGELSAKRGGNSGNLMTYRELCSIANDMGQPELLYKFMDLANHQASLQSRRGAAVGFGHIAEIAGADLKPYLTTLLPRIYRLRFDPSPVVQETMQNIWRSLVPDDRAALETHLELILKELLTEITSRLWRHRESSCRALAELLGGRKWSELKPSFEEIWKMAFRAADDIKETVRVAGVQLMKTLKRLTLRFVDPHVTEAPVVAEVVAATLPVLLDVLTHPKVAETVALAFSTLSSLASSCPESHLRPHLALLIPTLLESLSNLEAKQLDELQSRAEGVGVASEAVESLRVRVSHQSPIQDVLQRCLRALDASVLEELMPKLREVIQRGVGLNTRVGTARFVMQLTTQLGSELSPYASKLLKLFLTKALTGETTTATRKAYSAAIGALCKVASASVVEKVVEQCREAVKAENSAHNVVPQIFKDLHSQAPTQFSQQAGRIVPLAFLMRYEEEDTAKGAWASVLEEAIGTESGAVRLYHSEILDEVIPALNHSRWTTRAASAQAIKRLYQVDSYIMESYSSQLMELLLEQLSGRIWDGKEALLNAIAQICSATPAPVQSYDAALVEALKAACTRGKKEYREAALKCLAAVVKHLANREALYSLVMPFLVASAEESLGGGEAATKLPFVGVIQCVANSRSGLDVRQLAAAQDGECFSLFQRFLTAPWAWHLKNAVLQSLSTFLRDAEFDPDPLLDRLSQLTTGAFVCLEEVKYEQLRLSALEALTAIAATAQRYSLLIVRSNLETRLALHCESERSFTVKLKVEQLISSLRAEPQASLK